MYIMDEMNIWIEKYRPSHLSEIVGNEKNLQALTHWAQQWKKNSIPRQRSAILHGPAGIGKTTTAHALAKDMGWTPIELNASDARNAPIIQRIIGAGAHNQTFNDEGDFITTQQGGRKLLILDECDNLYERLDSSRKSTGKDLSDRGGKRALIDIIKTTQQPIILIANDYKNLIKGSGSALKTLSLSLRFDPISARDIARILSKICKEEHISISNTLLIKLAEASEGDVRSAVNDIQTLSANRTSIQENDIESIGNRNREITINEALDRIFTTTKPSELRGHTIDLDMTPNDFLHWVSENMPRLYTNVDELLTGYESLSKADVFLGRVSRRSYYGFWSYASDLTSIGVAAAKKRPIRHHERYRFSSWIIAMSKTKSKRHEQDAIAEKISHITHQSKEKTASSMLPTLKRVLPRDTDLAVQLTKKLDLNVKELQYLVGEQSKEIHLLATQPTPQEKKPSTAQATNNQNIQAQTKLGEN